LGGAISPPRLPVDSRALCEGRVHFVAGRGMKREDGGKSNGGRVRGMFRNQKKVKVGA